MKNQLLLFSTLVLTAFTFSCTRAVAPESQVGINPDQIAFRSSVGVTRANDNGVPAVEGGFNVVGLNQDGSYIAGFAAPAGDNETYFFDNVSSPNAWDWKNAASKTNKLWPTDEAKYPLTFFAAYPLTTAVTKDAKTVAANVVSNLTNGAFIYNTYYNGVPITFTSGSVSVDELAAMVEVQTRPASGFADLKFKHIMSNMAFKVVVPANFKAYVQSIKIANVNKSGRSFDYQSGTWSAESSYSAANNAHFAHYIGSAQTITSASSTVNGLSDGASGFNTLKLMPQKEVAIWSLGDKDAPAANTFRADAAAWKASLTGGVVDAAAITKWHTAATSAKGMMDSKGWEGARIELTYILVDETGGAGNEKAVVGKKSGVEGAVADAFVRVGYELDLKTLNANLGWESGKRYTFSIPLGTAGATNGVLLDPDYKDGNGDNTDKPVDNPKTEPGNPVTKAGTIQFKVDVDAWTDADVSVN